ncbi:uncharacterized protein PHACADRAFT_143002 [Phanerochaete carnosa HHB-10118-sp]|uniref:F-box domain-containing protein n=1 Tax=Phanerochaete carnosa (strain HHB-10118-sp) TaxID=650164 RepID=K5W7E7_PHACS|nr:uncharacterized protein PHACADRAFT_143002 [Phanerochaete carnosa HHB-10118-sp]EKM55095.1 hypothetical protein PHACADRAFT_143002 [Phanerochaete carnosa HHB-10118-sp]
MQHATGADLPPELLSRILDYLNPPDKIQTTNAPQFEFSWDEYHRLKRGLAAPSLVCKHWSEATRPLLFSRLHLRSAEDVHFLRNVVDNPCFKTSSLSKAIQVVQINLEATQTRPWLHHVYWLSSRLQETTFIYAITSSADDSTSMVGHRDLFRSLPRVPPPSILRLSTLVITRLRFASTTEFARFVDSIPSLQRLLCDGLSFLDPSPVVQARRRRPQRSLSSLFECKISQCGGMPLSDQAALAADVVSIAARVGLDVHAWDVALQALLTLAPETFQETYICIWQPGDISLSMSFSWHGQ